MRRRAFLSLAAAAGLTGAGALAGCSGSSTAEGDAAAAAAGGGGGAGLRWWDHFSALQRFHREWAAAESTAIGTPIAYTYNDVSRATEGLQLAKQSGQLPDVYSNILGLPLAALVQGGWVHELALPPEAVAGLPPDAFVEGITTLDGVVYGLPLFSARQYAAAHWFLRPVVERAGLDPDDPPRTYDEYRAALRAVRRSDQEARPMIAAIGGFARVREQMDDLAQAAGFPGYQGMDFRTGDFRYDDDAYLTCIELWKELQDDGLFYPGSGRLTVASARTRWAAGVAAYFPDGPWCAGGVKNVAPGVEEQLGVGPLLVPDASMTAVAYRGAPASQFFVAATTADPEAATALVASMTSTEYLQGLARGMDQPPLDLTAVDTPGVIEPYRQLAGWFLETVKTAPEPVVRNAAVAAVEAASRPLTPDLGTIVQGYLGGDVPDLRRALRQLSDAAERDREQALAAAVEQGAEVSRDDFAFPDWQPGQDYTYS